MKSYIKSVAVLTAICGIIAILLSAANGVTAPIISENENAAANEALLVVMPGGEGFQPVDLTGKELPATVTEVFSEKNGGYVVKLKTAGYGTDMVIMCGVDAAGTVTGATCLSSNETLGYEQTYGESAKGATAETVDALDVISGATKTTEGYKNAVKDALNTAVILGGGSVDLRSEEEILNDNLSAALPAGEGKFTELFITEELADISAIYIAENGAGAVCVSGEQFIAVSGEGHVLSDGVEEMLSGRISDQAKKALSSTVEELDLSKYSDLPSQLKKAYETSYGSYVFELAANGFGITGDEWYGPSGKPILLKVAVSEEGKIITCKTLEQYETEGIGSACADASFYTQFNGKDESNYKEIDGISGATLTTNGYKTAVGKVFEIVKILKGEA